MDNNGKRDVSKKSDFLLELCVKNPENYSTESVEEAIAELQRRGRVFTEQELAIMRQPLPPEDNIYTGVPVIHRGWKTRRSKYNIVQDLDAPLLYSQGAIFSFTALCGSIFGAVLLAANIKSLGHKKQSAWIIVFGIVYIIIQISILRNIEMGFISTYSFNLGSALIFDFFWHRYIGYNTLYRAKPIWKPLIIAIIIHALLFLSLIYGK
ncbi:MAG: hypothetical protein V4592_23590 [Bacteroidota bacterium]